MVLAHAMPEQLQLFDRPAAMSRLQLALARARDLLTLAGVKQAPVDIEWLARLLSVREIRPFKFARAQACLLPSRHGCNILVEETADPRRQRYSIGHELGHLILRANGIRFRDYFNRQRAIKEEELCDEIANELLIPEELFKVEIRGKACSIETIRNLAGIFATPMDVAAIRMGQLVGEHVQVILWEQRGNQLKAKRTSGPQFIRPGAQRLLSDMTCGPVLAYATNEPSFTYESPRRWHSRLTLACESMAFKELSSKYVVSVLRDDG